MASGSAGEPGAPVPTSGGPEQVPNMRLDVDNMMDSITTLHRQMAALMEDPETFMNRRRTTESPGPAVRARSQDHEMEIDRTRMREIEELIRDCSGRIDQLVVGTKELEARMTSQEACLASTTVNSLQTALTSSESATTSTTYAPARPPHERPPPALGRERSSLRSEGSTS